ncbi:endolytic transglycosylase MltG [Patescibacteria group bacterium]|nr:endolytic transglycosylase MltG [Patescibacteria group bacterium]MBU1728003.1 endolytic transglycosylase MltG [Patescibacteria group bacterium]
MKQKIKIIVVIISVLVVAIVALLILYSPQKEEKLEETPVIIPQQVPEQEKIDMPNNEIKEVETVLPIPEGTDRFIVTLADTKETIANNLFEQEYISDKEAFVKFLDEPSPGGYKISKEMTPEQLASVLKGKPYMKWVKIPEGLRKEEIAQLLKDTLGWSEKEKVDWITKDTTQNTDYLEGVYFPDTYLIPIDESPLNVAKRLISKFNENFAPYTTEFYKKNIKWTTALTLASIVQRESPNDVDAPLIAGILWNRLNQKMYLNVDATLQYIRGDKGNGWWAPISIADKKTDSPYNTYMYTGLPPHPISNPGLPAIEAVLNPKQTDCFYYIHDKNRITHCAVTYEEHQANIEQYLK